MCNLSQDIIIILLYLFQTLAMAILNFPTISQSIPFLASRRLCCSLAASICILTQSPAPSRPPSEAASASEPPDLMGLLRFSTLCCHTRTGTLQCKRERVRALCYVAGGQSWGRVEVSHFGVFCAVTKLQLFLVLYKEVCRHIGLWSCESKERESAPMFLWTITFPTSIASLVVHSAIIKNINFVHLKQLFHELYWLRSKKKGFRYKT